MIENLFNDVDSDNEKKQTRKNRRKVKRKSLPPIIPFNWKGKDTAYIMILLFFGVFSRVWILWSPRIMTNDDYDALKKIHKYQERRDFYDGEPYLGPLTYMLFTGKMEYNKEYRHLVGGTNTAYSTTNYNSLRSINALYATLAVPLCYCACRLFNIPSFYSFIAGFSVLVEPSLIASGRSIGFRGIAQLYTVISLCFSGISYHYQAQTIEKNRYLILQYVFTGFALSVSFNTTIIYIFGIFWALREKDKQMLVISILMPLFILLCTCLAHILMITENNKQVQFGPYSVYKSTMLMFKLLLNRLQSFAKFSPRRFLRRLTFTEKWYVVWNENERYSAAFTNRFTTIPSLILSIIQVASTIRHRTRSVPCVLSLAFLGGLILYALEPGDKGPMDAYVVVILSAISGGAAVFTAMRQSLSIVYGIVTFAIAGVAFLDWAPLVYAYYDPAPVITTYFKP